MSFNTYTADFLKTVIKDYNHIVNIKGHHKMKKAELVEVMNELFYIDGNRIYPKNLNFNQSFNIPAKKKTVKEQKEERLKENRRNLRILGLLKYSTLTEIKKAYKKLAVKFHPDKQGGDDKKFIEIDTAYKALVKSYKRS